MRILIAEDDLTSRAMLAGVLKKSGHEVVETADGAAAWEAMQQQDAPALAILDWLMPKMNGPEVARKIRSLPTDRPPYLIMLSTKGNKSDIIDGLDAGANDYLPKPFDPGELRARIEVGRRMVALQAELSEKNAELERFLYTASHDLKSPVVTVRTFLGYLEEDLALSDAGRVEKDVRFIRLAADKIAHLLDDLLEISRIGRTLNQNESMTFANLLDASLASVAGIISERGVKVKVDAADLTLHGDRIRLEEIWQNLLENACKFMGDQNEPLIQVGAEKRGDETVFFVRDNGGGIDPRHSTKVFGLFDKLDPKSDGTGLGLAIVKRIVELYQGRIWVESQGSGHGACFRFTLPGAMQPTKENTIS
ncbi:MAG: response regulator [Verrucomicrobiae bacterium]